jgi:hypothetical protein
VIGVVETTLAEVASIFRLAVRTCKNHGAEDEEGKTLHGINPLPEMGLHKGTLECWDELRK